MIHRIITTFFGLGYAPIAPGTFGALGAIIVYCLFLFMGLDHQYLNATLFILIILFLGLGIYSTNKVIPNWGKDPSKVVVDETVGQWIAMLFIPPELIYIVMSLILFRFFDISKILFIKKAESLPGGIGVMMDDVLAGLYSFIILQIILKLALL
jgi:phosphatidylglycerophosphatase A